jgi:hypothetical protein
MTGRTRERSNRRDQLDRCRCSKKQSQCFALVAGDITDWPHVGFWGPMPNVGELLDVLADWAPDTRVRNAILVDNPHALYGFGTT